MTLREQTACFTGSRQLAAEERGHLLPQLTQTVETLLAEGIRYFGVGGALGFDELAARAVLSLREAHPQLRLILVLPCPDWNRLWPSADRDRYAWIVGQADKMVTVAPHYHPGCMQMRNRYLVDNSAVCVCCRRSDTGGTAYTARYAEKQGLRLIWL